MVALVSGGAAPGVTTSACALAAGWPGPVVLVDADPAGGQVLAGWLGPWFTQGRVQPARGVVSFVTASRHSPSGSAAELVPHLQPAPSADWVRVLLGVRDAAQAGSVEEAGWRRLAQALTDPALVFDGERADVVVDAGRVGPVTPWPLLAAADVVLVGVRATLRAVAAAHAALAVLQGRVEPARLGLLACASTPAEAREVERALGMPVHAVLARDPSAAGVFSDGATPGRGLARSALVRAARTSGHRLRRWPAHVEPAGLGVYR